MRRWVPAEIERTVYVLATELCPVLLLAWWQPMHGRVWWVDGTAAVVLWGLCVAGWVLAIAATYAVDQLELTGLRQAGWFRRADGGSTDGGADGVLHSGGLYAVVPWGVRRRA